MSGVLSMTPQLESKVATGGSGLGSGGCGCETKRHSLVGSAVK